jgi:hypothetical protein
METRITALLYRFDCPTALELGEYYLGLVNESRRAYIAQHLPLCPRCSAELASYQVFMTQPDVVAEPRPAPPQPGLLQKVKWLVADLVQPPAALAPAYRGAGDALRNYRAGDYDISLDVQNDADQPGHKLIVGLLLSNQQAGGAGVTVELQTHDTSVPAEVDELGNFILAGIAPGVYDLVISDAAHDVAIRIPGFDVQP